MIGDVYKYLGGDEFLDRYLMVGRFYTIHSMDEIDGKKFVTFEETNKASYIHILETHFKDISKEREIKLTTLLD